MLGVERRRLPGLDAARSGWCPRCRRARSTWLGALKSESGGVVGGRGRALAAVEPGAGAGVAELRPAGRRGPAAPEHAGDPEHRARASRPTGVLVTGDRFRLGRLRPHARQDIFQDELIDRVQALAGVRVGGVRADPAVQLSGLLVRADRGRWLPARARRAADGRVQTRWAPPTSRPWGFRSCPAASSPAPTTRRLRRSRS